eukprot:652343-Pyramimonas_sp.AAC.1
MLKATRPPSVKLLPLLKFQNHKWCGRLRRNARPALKPGLGVRQGEIVDQSEGAERSFIVPGCEAGSGIRGEDSVCCVVVVVGVVVVVVVVVVVDVVDVVVAAA